MAENTPRLQAVTPDYEPVTPEHIFPGQLEASPHKPVSGLNRIIHERQKAVARNEDLYEKFVKRTDDGVTHHTLFHTLGGGTRNRSGVYRDMGTHKEPDV